MSTFRELLSAGAPLAELAAAADSLGVEERIELVRALSGKDLARLWELARAGTNAPVELAFFVPSSTPPGHTVEWQGRNSLPMFSHFSKRFTRGTSRNELVGQNHTPTEWLIGPGYFTATVHGARSEEFLLDYTRYPASAPKGWPPLKPNERGLGRLVFAGMQDFMRPVGAHLAIGAAFDTTGKSKNAWFVLARGQTLPFGN